MNKTARFVVASSLFLYTVLLIISCGNEEKKPDVSKVPVSLKTHRFEQDLMTAKAPVSLMLRNKYPHFYDLYFFQLVRIGSPESTAGRPLMESRIADFVSDPDIQAIYNDTRQTFPDFTSLDGRLTDAFRHYRYYFPKKTIPQTLTFISGFNNAIVCADSVLAIGLDMYLGRQSKYYHALQFPVYRIAKMDGAYIPTDAMKGWLQSEWTEPESNADLLSHMIYAGKIQYALKKLMPEEADTLITGYSAAQLEWCMKNEKNVWSFFIDHKLLFATELNLIMKYVTEGPTTGGFPKESPGNLGQWIGYKIVQSYAKKKMPDDLAGLLNENDYKKILQESGYKPE